MRILKSLIILLAIVLQSCGGGDNSPAPLKLGAFELTFPNNNQVCTEGVDISNNMVSIPFRWNSSENATAYTLEVTNTVTGKKYETTTTVTSDQLTIPKGIQFNWKVTAILNGEFKTSKSTWNFYSEGIVTSNHIPFPATITLQDNKDGTININWIGSDIDNDIKGYEVYINTTDNIIANTQQTSISNFSITYNINYLLGIIIKDQAGNSSTSTKEFKFRN